MAGKMKQRAAGSVRTVDGEHRLDELGVAFRHGYIDPSELEAAAQLFPTFELLPGEERPEPGERLVDYPVFAWLTQREAAKLLSFSTRQVQNLEVRGLPSRGARKSKRYALPHLLIWFRAYKRRGGSEGKVRQLSWRVALAEHELDAARMRLDLAERESR